MTEAKLREHMKRRECVGWVEMKGIRKGARWRLCARA